MTQNLTPAERSKRAESAARVVVQHKGRDHQMTGTAYSRLLDRVAAKVKGRTSLGAAEQTLLAKAGWDAPPMSAHAPLTADDELMTRAGWAD